MDLLPPWVMSTLEELVAHKSPADSRVQLGFAFDGLWLPKEVIVSTFDKVKSLGIKVITTHFVHTSSSCMSPPPPPQSPTTANSMIAPNSTIELYNTYGILDSHILSPTSQAPPPPTPLSSSNPTPTSPAPPPQKCKWPSAPRRLLRPRNPVPLQRRGRLPLQQQRVHPL